MDEWINPSPPSATYSDRRNDYSSRTNNAKHQGSSSSRSNGNDCCILFPDPVYRVLPTNMCHALTRLRTHSGSILRTHARRNDAIAQCLCIPRWAATRVFVCASAFVCDECVWLGVTSQRVSAHFPVASHIVHTRIVARSPAKTPSPAARSTRWRAQFLWVINWLHVKSPELAFPKAGCNILPTVGPR